MDSPLPMYVCDFNSFPPTHSHSGLCGSVALQPTSCRENHLLTPLICRGKHHPMQLKLEGGNSFFSQLGSNCDQTIQWSCDWHLQRCLVCLCLVESHFSGNTHTYAILFVKFLLHTFSFNVLLSTHQLMFFSNFDVWHFEVSNMAIAGEKLHFVS